MNKKLKTIVLLTIMALGNSPFAISQSNMFESEKQVIELYVNNEKFLLHTTSQNVRIDIYSILGSRVTSFEIRSGYAETSINLPRGYYIIKADNTSRKIVVR